MRENRLPTKQLAWLVGPAVVSVISVGFCVPRARAAAPKRLSNDQKILIALNRLEFGPRPGDLEAVKKMGLKAWIEQQLNPEKIDDSAVEKKLAAFPTLKMSAQELFDNFREDQMQIRQRLQAAGANPANGQPGAGQPGPGQQQPILGQPGVVAPNGLPGGGLPGRRPFAGQNPNGQPMNPGQQMMQPGMRPAQQAIQALGELNDSKLLRAVESNRQLQEVLVDFWSNHFNVDVKKGQVRAFKPAEDRDVIRPHILGKFRELLEADAKSPAMLFYLDNAVSTRDFNDPKTAPPMGMRPGGFRPGIGPGGFPGRGPGQGGFQRPGGLGGQAGLRPGMQRPGAPGAQPGRRAGGLNENYGRELLELHTLGVDGGYTQKDVQEVARCFTGWTINRQTGGFQFQPFLHDYGEKIVLGQKVPAGRGIEDGEQVLDIVAAHPSTARFISTKLCMRFISDTPPQSIVDKVSKTFLSTRGDLREVVRTIVTSNEFLAPEVYRAKMKSPFEYAVSAVRALGGEFETPNPDLPRSRFLLVADGAVSMGRGPMNQGARPAQAFLRKSMIQEIAAMGQPLFSHEAPTGYPEDSREWVSSGSLLARFNFAQDLTGGRIGFVSANPASLAAGQKPGDHKAVLATLTKSILGDNVSDTTKAAILHEMENGADTVKSVALLLGSPEFQRR
jgi:uncharacterized protein (DUF1800 family)